MNDKPRTDDDRDHLVQARGAVLTPEQEANLNANILAMHRENEELKARVQELELRAGKAEMYAKELLGHKQEGERLHAKRVQELERLAINRVQEIAAYEQRVEELERDIDKFWHYVENAYDIEPRAYFEKEAPTNGFGSPLAQASHHIWKRDPKVGELEREVAALKEQRDAALSISNMAVESRMAMEREVARLKDDKDVWREQANRDLRAYNELAEVLVGAGDRSHSVLLRRVRELSKVT